jgi:hypothetical protein
MALVYVALCALVLVLRWTAGWREGRSKRRYARQEEKFRAAERDCKAEEVRVGRPAGYADQIRLLNAFESRERARLAWIGASGWLQKVQGWFATLRAFQGRRVSYMCGLVDAAAVLTLLDRLTHVNVLSWNLPVVVQALRVLL